MGELLPAGRGLGVLIAVESSLRCTAGCCALGMCRFCIRMSVVCASAAAVLKCRLCTVPTCTLLHTTAQTGGRSSSHTHTSNPTPNAPTARAWRYYCCSQKTSAGKPFYCCCIVVSAVRLVTTPIIAVGKRKFSSSLFSAHRGYAQKQKEKEATM